MQTAARSCSSSSSRRLVGGCCGGRSDAHHHLLRGRRPSHSHGPTHMCRAAAVQSSALQQLLDWGGANGASTDKVSLVADVLAAEPGTRILVAGKDVGAGEQLLVVPDSAWLTPAAASRHPTIGRHVAGLEPWLQLALLLLAEAAAGSSSKLQPYLAAAAPGSGSAHLDSPLFWSEEELQLLAGTQLLESVRGYKQFFQEQYEQLQASLCAPNQAAFPADTFSFDRFVWAVATVRSRLHAPLDADPVALVPLADALPHSRASNVVWRTKGAGMFGRGGQVLSVEATRPLRKGEALALDYGPERPDNSLLLDYGVIDWANAQGGYALTLTLPEEDTYYEDKAAILADRAGLGTAASFTITRGQEPTREMMGFLRLMQLSGADCFLLESIFEAEVWEFMCEPVSAANEAAVCAAMAAGASEALAGYGTTIDEDLTLLREGGLVQGSRQEKAVQVRLGEKEALDGLLGFFEGRGADLKALEYYQERRLKRLGLMDEDGSTTYDSFFRDGIA